MPPVDDSVGAPTCAASGNFQTKFGLPPDGILGLQSRELLKKNHGC
jgi:murein L,D-transpeptidase YcbB/YkuD